MQLTATSQYETGEYLDKVPEWHAGDSPWKARKVAELLHRAKLTPSSICDVGCGAGGVLANLQTLLEAGTRFVGYDISPQAIALCRSKEKEGLCFRQADFLSESDDVFDMILLLDVFEHIPDYLGFLSDLHGRAKWFVFHIPLDLNVEAVLRRSAPALAMRARYGHLHYFTAETALATLTDAGYEIRDFVYTWDTEIDGLSPPLPGFRGKLRYPLTCVIYLIERQLFRRRPALIARLRKRYNLLVLARGGRG